MAGKFDKAKGNAEEKLGEAKERLGAKTDNRSMQADGLQDQVEGKAHQVEGEVKERIDRADDDRLGALHFQCRGIRSWGCHTSIMADETPCSWHDSHRLRLRGTLVAAGNDLRVAVLDRAER